MLQQEHYACELNEALPVHVDFVVVVAAHLEHQLLAPVGYQVVHQEEEDDVYDWVDEYDQSWEGVAGYEFQPGEAAAFDGCLELLLEQVHLEVLWVAEHELVQVVDGVEFPAALGPEVGRYESVWFLCFVGRVLVGRALAH